MNISNAQGIENIPRCPSDLSVPIPMNQIKSTYPFLHVETTVRKLQHFYEVKTSYHSTKTRGALSAGNHKKELRMISIHIRGIMWNTGCVERIEDTEQTNRTIGGDYSKWGFCFVTDWCKLHAFVMGGCSGMVGGPSWITKNLVSPFAVITIAIFIYFGCFQQKWFCLSLFLTFIVYHHQNPPFALLQASPLQFSSILGEQTFFLFCSYILCFRITPPLIMTHVCTFFLEDCYPNHTIYTVLLQNDIKKCLENIMEK